MLFLLEKGDSDDPSRRAKFVIAEISVLSNPAVSLCMFFLHLHVPIFEVGCVRSGGEGEKRYPVGGSRRRQYLFIALPDLASVESAGVSKIEEMASESIFAKS